MFNESLNSWLYSDVQEHRTCDDLTNQFKWLVVEQFLDAIFFMLVMDLVYKRLSLDSLVFLLLLFISYGLLLFAKLFDRRIGKLFPTLSGCILFLGVMMHYGF